MSQEQWTAVDRYITELVVPADAVLDAALADSVAAGLPTISVSPNQGKFLNLLARIQGARSILEIGTLGGYSTIWLARAMPEGGRLITLESEPKHADVARANIGAPTFPVWSHFAWAGHWTRSHSSMPKGRSRLTSCSSMPTR